MIQMFQDDMEIRMQTLSRELTSNNAVEVTKLLHSIEGSSRQIGALKLATLAEYLEKAAKTADVSDGASKLLALDLHFRNARKAMASFVASSSRDREPVGLSGS